MQAWNSVKVTSNESAHAGRAGTVVRIERRGGLELVQVWLDADGEKPAEMEPFAPVELVLL